MTVRVMDFPARALRIADTSSTFPNKDWRESGPPPSRL